VNHELAQEGQAVHPRHFDVEDDDVRPVLDDQIASFERIVGPADHTDVLGSGQYPGEDGPDQCRVIHDEYLDGAATSHGATDPRSRRTAPTSRAAGGERPRRSSVDQTFL